MIEELEILRSFRRRIELLRFCARETEIMSSGRTGEHPSTSRRSVLSSGGASSNEDMEDWDRRLEASVNVVDTDEFDSRSALLAFDFRCKDTDVGGDETSSSPSASFTEIAFVVVSTLRPAMNLPTPCMLSRIPFNIAAVCGDASDASNAVWILLPSAGELGAAAAPENPRLTIRSHLRFSSSNSVSCTASWERSSRHLDSFCAMKRNRSACLYVVGSRRERENEMDGNRYALFD